MRVLQPVSAHPAAAPDPAPAPRELLIWGAHGGAGTTTLATLLRPARDMGALRSPADYRYPALGPEPGAVAVTCRCTTWSALKASAAITALTRNGGRVDVLIVVSDGWPEPPIATAWFRLLSAQASVVRVPFVTCLRLCNDPVLARLPRSARQALAQIRAITCFPEGGRDAAHARDTHLA